VSRVEATAQAVVSAHRHLHRVIKYKYNEAGNQQEGLQVSVEATKDVKDARQNTRRRKAKRKYHKPRDGYIYKYNERTTVRRRPTTKEPGSVQNPLSRRTGLIASSKTSLLRLLR
jgi:hypothetical protein